MFKDYSADIDQIKDSLRKALERLDSIEKNVNGVSDEVNDVRNHLGLGRSARRGKRHPSDIERFIRWYFKKVPDAETKHVYYAIQDFLIANEEIDFHMSPYNDKGVKEYDEWSKNKFEEIKEGIENIRQDVLNEAKEDKNERKT